VCRWRKGFLVVVVVSLSGPCYSHCTQKFAILHGNSMESHAALALTGAVERMLRLRKEEWFVCCSFPIPIVHGSLLLKVQVGEPYPVA